MNSTKRSVKVFITHGCRGSVGNRGSCIRFAIVQINESRSEVLFTADIASIMKNTVLIASIVDVGCAIKIEKTEALECGAMSF